MRSRDEVIIPFAFPEEARAVRAVRTTLIASSILSLRSRGLYDRYVALLADEHRDAILGAVAGAWIGVDVTSAHYEACDALGLAPAVQRAIGEEVGDRAQKTFFGFLIRSATSAGITPWTAFNHVHRARERMFLGGDVLVEKVGPKEARVTSVGLPFVRFAYFRNAFVGVQTAGVRLFARKVYAHEVPERGAATTFVTIISWA